MKTIQCFDYVQGKCDAQKSKYLALDYIASNVGL